MTVKKGKEHHPLGAFHAVQQGHKGEALDLNGLAAQAVHETHGDVVARKTQ